MNTPKLHYAFEALLPQPDIDWLIQDFIALGQVLVFAGGAGSGKTYALLYFAACVAGGFQGFGNRKIKQANVLFLDEESGGPRFNKRLAAIMNAINADSGLPLFYTIFAGFNFRQQSSFIELQKIIIDQSIGLVIIDALMDVIPGADENASKDMAPIMNGLKAISEKTGATISVIHHWNKNGKIRGSEAIKGVTDLLINVEKKGNQITFKSEKNRDGEPFEFAAEAHFETDKFYLTEPGKNSISNYKTKFDDLSTAERVIIKYLANFSTASKSDLENLQGSAKKTLIDAIYKIVSKGYIERIDDGARGTAAFYGLTDAGTELAVYAKWVNDPWVISDFAYVF